MGKPLLAKNFEMRLAVEAVSSPPMVLLVLWFIAAHLQGRTTLFENGIGIEEIHFDHIRIGLEKVFVAVVKAEYTITVLEEGLGHGADDRVDSRCRTTAGENYDGFFHIFGFKDLKIQKFKIQN